MSKGKITLNSNQTSSATLVNTAVVGGANIVLNGNNMNVTGSINGGNIVGLQIIELQGSHTLNATDDDAHVKEILVQEGVLKYTKNFPLKLNNQGTVDITIGSKGKVDITGSDLWLINKIDISNGGEFNYTINKTTLNGKEFNDLIKVKYFVLDNFYNQKDILVEYSQVKSLNLYQECYSKLDKKIVQKFIAPTNSPEKKIIDFVAIDKFINDNYFELTGIAKNPLEKGFEGKLGTATEILQEISSFLTLNDVVKASIEPLEENIDISGGLDAIDQ